MIGDKRLEMPKVGWDCKEIYNYFGLKGVRTMDDEFFPNARRLVELNNEIYDKLHDRQWLYLQQKEQFDAEQQALNER